MTVDPADLKRWVRLLTLPLAALHRHPEKVEARVGRGLHLLLSSEAEGLLHLCFSLAGDTPEAARKTPTTAMSFFGDRQPEGLRSTWVEEVFAALGHLEAQDPDGWVAFLAKAGDEPAVALPYAAGPDDRASSGEELLLRITGRCNAACAFCSARGILPDLVEGEFMVRERLRRARRAGRTKVSITGGEPTLDRRLAGYIRLARELGFCHVDLQTNGVRLARPGRVERLAEAGLGSIFLSLHAAEPAAHDRLLGLDGAFLKAIDAAERCLEAGIEVAFNCVLTTENVAGVVDYVAFLGRRFGRRGLQVCLSSCAPQGWARDHLELLPRLSTSAALLSEAIGVGQSLGLRVSIPGLCGVPMCTLPDHLPAFDEYHQDEPPLLADRGYGEGCEACRLRLRCSGFWSVYLDRYGVGELVPL